MSPESRIIDAIEITPGRAPEITCSFTIRANDLDVDGSSRYLGLEPDTVWRQRHEGLKSHPELPDTAWILESKSESLRSTSEVMGLLLGRIWPERETIREFLAEKGLRADFTCTVKIWEDRPLYDLKPEILQKLAWFGLEYVLDIYDYS